MIDPLKLTNFNRTLEELQEFLLWIVFRDGRADEWAAKILDAFLNLRKPGTRPFEWCHSMILSGELESALYGMGVRSHKKYTIEGLLNIDPATVAPAGLENTIYYFTLSDARKYLIHTREGYRGIPLEYHVLNYLRDNGVKRVASHPPQFPKEYKRLENAALKIAEKQNKSPIEFYSSISGLTYP